MQISSYTYIVGKNAKQNVKYLLDKNVYQP
jgi:hypothetical protein